MNFQQMLNDFEEYHQNFFNRILHYAGISTITISAFGLLWNHSVGPVNLALVLLGATLLLDLIICRAFAFTVLCIGSFFLLISLAFNDLQLIGLFVLGWAFQLLGHKFAERNRPAFTKNLIHLFVGPRWMVMQWLHPLGIKLMPRDHLALNTDLLDFLRWLLVKLVPPLGSLANTQVRKLIEKQNPHQLALRKKYAVENVLPTPYTEDLRNRIISLQASLPGSVFIYTSGSTSRPKQIIYNKERIRQFKQTSKLSGLQIFKFLKVINPSIFVFSSLQQDDSFASLIVSQKPKLPALFTALTEPAKFLFHPYLKEVINAYGANAARLWVMALGDPAVLYATNPSTLAVFLEDVSSQWPHYKKMFQDFIEAKGPFENVGQDKEWTKLIARLAHGPYGIRVKKLSACASCPDFSLIAPSLKAYVCWDGGYVTAFLKQIVRHLPPEKYFHVPMFSMSTETLQTQTFIHADRFYFLPLAQDVFYEFMPEGSGDLLLPHELEAGKSYVMVVSDKWGLKRYNTQDVFLCKALYRQWPDLAFLKRQGLSYSFTGEKLTGEQIVEAIAKISETNKVLDDSSVQLTLIPSRPADGLPHYVLLLALVGNALEKAKGEELALQFEAALASINKEYLDKRASGRLGPLKIYIAPYDHVVKHLDSKTITADDNKLRSWESQFKLTPLTLKLWQEIGLEKN